MSKNKGKGGKGKRKGKKQGDERARELEFKDEDQEYGQVNKVLGNCRLEVNCFDGTVRICHIRGKFKKRVWINQGDIVLLGLRDFQNDKADVIHKYSPDEAQTLKAYGELPASVVIGGSGNAPSADGETNEYGVNFGSCGNSESEGDEQSEGDAPKKDEEAEEAIDWNKALEEL